MNSITEPMYRVEGEGEIIIYVDEHKVVMDLEYKITEAPRFFEYIVKGVHYTLIPDIVSRICGLCGVSYIVTSVKAFEKCLGIDIPEKAELYREITHLAERVKSHIIHVLLLNLPDLIDAKNVLELERLNPGLLNKIVALVGLADKLMKLVAGRFHNAVNIRVGGLYKQPDITALERIKNIIKNEILPLFTEVSSFILSLETLPRTKQSLEYCVLVSNHYPTSSTELEYSGSKFSVDNFYEDVVKVSQKHGKNCLIYTVNNKPYIVGPYVRFNRYHSYLLGETKEFLKKYGWFKQLENIYESVIARIAEVYDALHRILELISSLESSTGFTTHYVETKPVKDGGYCYYAIEAPRGILYQRFNLDESGRVVSANIVTPTAQNIALAEDITRKSVRGLTVEKAIKLAKKIIVSLDPCISCSVHSLNVRIVNYLEEKPS